MLDIEDYNYYKKALMKRKTKPYIMSNKEMAIDFFEKLKREFSEASIHFYGSIQYICLGSRARKNLFAYFIKKMADIEKIKQECEIIMQELDNVNDR